MNEKREDVLEKTEEVRNAKKKNYNIRNWGKIKMMMKMKQRKCLNEMHQMQAEILKRTMIETKIETKMNKKAEKIKQKYSKIDNLSKNGQVTNDIQSEILRKNRIINFLNKKIEIKSEKEVATLPDCDRKTTKFQKPVERKLKKPKKKKLKLKKKVQKKKEKSLKKEN